jgi:hypothetical protein
MPPLPRQETHDTPVDDAVNKGHHICLLKTVHRTLIGEPLRNTPEFCGDKKNTNSVNGKTVQFILLH